MFEKEEKFLKKIIVNAFRRKINKHTFKVNLKSEKDYVTNLDIQTEKYIIDNIKKRFPDDKFVSEEFNSKNKPVGRCWVIDPIDGTINFAKGIKEWCIQIAFLSDGKTRLSAIYIPYDDELYFANEIGAECNGKKICVNSCESSEDCLVACGQVHKNYNKINKCVKDLLNDFEKHILRYRNLGSSGKEYAYVAKGCFGAKLLFSDNKWDFLPGEFLCEKAGAYLLDGKILDKKVHAVFSNIELKNIYKNLIKSINDKYKK